jgi:hypothetical protein
MLKESIKMSRKRITRASWTYCETCGKGTTKIAKSIHGGAFKTCCGEWRYVNSKPLSFFEFEIYGNIGKQIEQMQISYGIAWGVEE